MLLEVFDDPCECEVIVQIVIPIKHELDTEP